MTSAQQDTLRALLQHYVKRKHFDDDKATRYVAAFIDLKGDGKKEAIVYLEGRWWCGSGGCPTLILATERSSYRIVTKILVTRPPIRVLTSTSNGWRNLAVWVRGGGIVPGYEAELRFDGKTYPTSAANPPALRLTRKEAGETIIPSSDDGLPLYP